MLKSKVWLGAGLMLMFGQVFAPAALSASLDKSILSLRPDIAVSVEQPAQVIRVLKLKSGKDDTDAPKCAELGDSCGKKTKCCPGLSCQASFLGNFCVED